MIVGLDEVVAVVRAQVRDASWALGLGPSHRVCLSLVSLLSRPRC